MDQTSNNEATTQTTTESQTPAVTEQSSSPQDLGVKGTIDAAISKATSPETKTEGTTPEAPAFNPNWKFKVLDKEHEVDEWVRPVVKDAESEKKIKELYEKAYGLEPVKASRDKIQKEHEELKTNYTSLYQDVSEAMQFKQQGDLGSFFQKVGLSDDQLAKYMLDKINRQSLPPEQQQVYNELEAKKRAEYYQAKQLEETEGRYRQIASQAREWEVDQWLARPEVNQIVERYDSANGKGAFKEYVAEFGVMHHSTYGEDPTVEAAVSSVMKRLGNAYAGQQAAPAPMQQSQNQEKPLPVIPNVSGKNVSPTRKSVRSVDDLRKIATEARE